MRPKNLFFFLCLILSGCDFTTDEDCEPVPRSCQKSRPDTVELKLKFSVSPNNPPARFQIYSGSVDEGHLILSDSALVETKGYLLPEGEYSIRAIYFAGKDTLEILEGGRTSIEVEDYCGGTSCYKSNAITLDLRLNNLPSGVKWP